MHIPDHENGTGTNTYEALNTVYIMMNNQMQRLGMNTVAWQEIRHAIILLTDGEYCWSARGSGIVEEAPIWGHEACSLALLLPLWLSVSYL